MVCMDAFILAGFAAGKEAAGVSLLLGFFKLGATLVAVASVEKLGRRPLLLGGVSAMVVSLLSLGAAQDSATAGGTASAWVCVVRPVLVLHWFAHPEHDLQCTHLHTRACDLVQRKALPPRYD
ncbi:hypothetical protein DUNSADRAFT_17241 [Dunaliella salina]|uniref:Uncharacterized protein n=1 Tax=Dunaliella salina TaxID=3046 RepID=A0ABQ7H0A2_DUNSA|nr:hypothetical protein DUNSADRAFT_17241 [Dunaliella salina]|eukprot:KAF5840272.1 hypothetical protein DUNSADRAFT_17241 [Dunaliella salina]